MNVTIDIQGQIEAAAALGLLPKNIKYAVSDTIRSVSGKYRTTVSREISSVYKIRARGFLKFRTSRNFNRIKVQARIFQGLNEIKAQYLQGKPRKVAGGAKIGGHFFPKAFVAIMKRRAYSTKAGNMRELIVMRERDGKRQSPSIPESLKYHPRWRLNLPIDEQTKPLPAAAGIVEKHFNALPAEISRVAEIQLRRQLTKMRLI